MKEKKGKDTIKNNVGLLAVPLAAVMVVFGIVAPGFAHKTFDLWIAACVGVAILAQVAGLKLKSRFMPLVPVLFYAGALGLIAYHCAPIVMDMINNLNFLDGNWTTVKVQIVLGVLSCAAAVASCFMQGDGGEKGDAAKGKKVFSEGTAANGRKMSDKGEAGKEGGAI